MRNLLKGILDSINSSLRKKLILIFISAIIIPLCFLVYISYRNFANNIQESYIINHIKLFEQLNSRIDDYFRNLDGISLSLYTDLLFSSDYQADGDVYQVYNLKMKKLLNIYLQRKETNSVVLYMPSNKEAYIINRIANSSYQNANEIENMDWYKNAVSNAGKVIIEPTHKLQGYNEEYSLNGDTPVFSVNRCINYNSKIYGILSINYNTEFLKKMLGEITNTNEDVLLINKEGFLICSTNDDTNNIIDAPLLGEIAAKTGKSGTFKYKDPDSKKIQLVTYSKLNYNCNIILEIIPVETVLAQAAYARNINLLISFIIIMLVLFMTVFISVWVTKPLQRLQKSMVKVGEGNFNVQVPFKKADEIGKISDSFNKMTCQINTLINEKYIMKLKYKEAQLKALNAQINPHFLYNTLQAFGSMAYDEGVVELDIMAKSLSDMLRYSIKSGGEGIVTLRDEVKNIQDYLAIQKFRYEEKLNYVIDISEDYYEIKVPKLIFQPIIENSIVHGIEPLKTPGQLIISCSTQDKGILLQIVDNGIGMTDEKLKEIQNELNNYDEDTFAEGEKIGISNVFHRLVLMFGQECCMSIWSRQDQGTRVTISIPQEEFNDDK